MSHHPSQKTPSKPTANTTCNLCVFLFLASASLRLYTLDNTEIRNGTLVRKLLLKFLCRTKEKENTITHTRHTYTCLISNSRQTFHSQFLGILCEYILSLTRLYVEYVNRVTHKAAYHSLSGATKWRNKLTGAPDYLQVLLGSLWRLMLKSYRPQPDTQDSECPSAGAAS